MPNGKKIDIIVGNNSYSTVANFSRSIASAFQRAGCQTQLFFVGKDCFYKAFYAILNNPPDLTFSFSNVTIAKKPIGSVLNIPHFSFLLDPAFYYLHQIESHNSFVSCIDRKDISVMLANKKSKEVGQHPIFLPHAVERSLFNKPKTQTNYDIVMTGTCYDFEKIRASWSQKFSHEVKKMLDIAQEMVLSPAGISCYEALNLLCGHIPEMKPYMDILHRELDIYITSKERIDLLLSLKGHSIHIFGKGVWKKYLPDANIHPQIPFSKALKIFSEAKIVINSSPRFKDGSHERVFTSLALKSLPLTGANPFFQEQFIDEQSILFYSYGNYQGINEKVAFYLSHDKRREEMIEKGREITFSYHTWDERVKILLSHIG